MKQDCRHYEECRKPTQLCNSKCPEYGIHSDLIEEDRDHHTEIKDAEIDGV